MGRQAKNFNRVVILVIDGLGAGEAPDAGDYGDIGSDTLDNLSLAVGGLKLPNLSSYGLGLIKGVDRVEKTPAPKAAYGRMQEASMGKDTSTGHWEMMGIILDEPFRTFPEGFPAELMDEFTRLTGYGYLGGGPASGTEILKELGEEHLKTRKLIVYTSADSVFQIAAHEALVPVEELYRVCAISRRLLDPYNVNRVIARPFVGDPGGFKRTRNRKDFSVPPPSETLLDKIRAGGVPVIGVGKIGDIFVGRGLTEDIHSKGDMDGMDRTIDAIKRTEGEKALIFTNLVDFDTLYAHRNDPGGAAGALKRIDGRLPEITSGLTDRDILVITADHGCDPTTPSTDHSREYVPLLVRSGGFYTGIDLGTRSTFSDLGATVAEALGIVQAELTAHGRSFLGDLLK
jgi:phosphopentomutase